MENNCLIYYPEFNLNNIVILNDDIYFVDFGLAKNTNDSNTDNCNIFIKLLKILVDKFKNKTLKQKHILYNTFMNNMRNLKLYTNNIF